MKESAVILSFNNFARDYYLEALPNAIENYLTELSHNELLNMVYEQMLDDMSDPNFDNDSLAEFVQEYNYE